jgi:cytochrome c oxidase subunit 2
MQRGPLIDGLPEWYIRHQLEKFREGVRGQNPENRSEALMGTNRTILQGVDNLEALAAFIAARPPQKPPSSVRGDPEKGEVVYRWCAGCHGVNGQGLKALKSPSLTMLEDWYVLDQLRKFKRGVRGTHKKDWHGTIMRYAVQSFSDRELKDVTAFIRDRLAASKIQVEGGRTRPPLTE